jgi:hypothetical protein
MPDTIASFPLRGAKIEELSEALGRSYAEYAAWHGQATFLAGFVPDARSAGVSSVLVDRFEGALRLAEKEGLLTWNEKKSKSNPEIAFDIAEHQLQMADFGVKIASAVMLHNACERLFHRIVRFGLIANRAEALRWIAERKVSVQLLATREAESLIDDHLEKWWNELERESLLDKWDRLVALVGYPSNLSIGTWHFDRRTLEGFDDARHNAVHHDGQFIKNFDLASFANQLGRAQLAWVVHIGVQLHLRIPAELFFGLKNG